MEKPTITNDGKTLQLGPVPVQYCAGASLRPLVTETLLAQGEDSDTFEGTAKYNELCRELRTAATADDPLWRQTMAALSVGPEEFARFESERIRAALRWPHDVAEVVKLLCDRHGVDDVRITLEGPVRDLASVDYCVEDLVVKYPEW